MASFMILFISLAALVAADCAWYQTDGITAARYTYRHFYDFRHLNDLGYLESAAFTNDWALQTWGKPSGPDSPLQMQYSSQNIWIERENQTDRKSRTHISLRTHRNGSLSSCAELVHTQDAIFHASIRVRARVHGDPGACVGIFTYRDDKNESDIEILTRDPRDHIRYTNQPGLDDNGDVIPGASSNVAFGNGTSWTDWNEHRLDWTPGLSAWYLNGKLAATKKYGIPRSPSSFILNIWSDGGSWSGEMAPGAAAYLDIQWIEMVYNTSAPMRSSNSTGRAAVCKVD